MRGRGVEGFEPLGVEGLEVGLLDEVWEAEDEGGAKGLKMGVEEEVVSWDVEGATMLRPEEDPVVGEGVGMSIGEETEALPSLEEADPGGVGNSDGSPPFCLRRRAAAMAASFSAFLATLRALPEGKEGEG